VGVGKGVSVGQEGKGASTAKRVGGGKRRLERETLRLDSKEWVGGRSQGARQPGSGLERSGSQTIVVWLENQHQEVGGQKWRVADSTGQEVWLGTQQRGRLEKNG
jgi:hypothetical protein